jgi:NTE family protein
MIALVRMLEERGVPIDVVSGVSGGTLVGAYYCKRRGADLDRCIDNGLLFQLLVLGAMFDSRLIRRRVDRDLGGVRVDDVDVRLVPVATALRHGRPPDAHVICGGTLGEAVQASGAAPGLFSSMQRKENKSGETTRYTDGASSRLIPARILPQYGADLVIAFNTIAGPRRRNPFEKHRTGRFLYEKTPVGRAIDLWVSVAFLVEQCSGLVAQDAHVFIEPLPHDEPFVEALWFARARAIVEDARSRDALREKADLCLKRWREFCANPAILGPGAEQAPLPRPEQRERAIR